MVFYIPTFQKLYALFIMHHFELKKFPRKRHRTDPNISQHVMPVSQRHSLKKWKQDRITLSLTRDLLVQWSLSGINGGHSFSTYAQRGRGVKQKRTPCVQGGRGAYTWKYVRKNVPFARVLRYFHMLEAFTMLCCHWRRLSFQFYKTFAMIIFLSLKCFSVYFSMELCIGYLKTPH